MQPKSPLPWKWVNNNPKISNPFSIWHNETHARLVDANDQTVLEEWLEDANDAGIKVNKENALFIEKAVNNHDKLLKMCKVTLAWLKANDPSPEYPNGLEELIREIDG